MCTTIYYLLTFFRALYGAAVCTLKMTVVTQVATQRDFHEVLMQCFREGAPAAARALAGQVVQLTSGLHGLGKLALSLNFSSDCVLNGGHCFSSLFGNASPKGSQDLR